MTVRELIERLQKLKTRLYAAAVALAPLAYLVHKLVDRLWHLLVGGCLGH